MTLAASEAARPDLAVAAANWPSISADVWERLSPDGWGNAVVTGGPACSVDPFLELIQHPCMAVETFMCFICLSSLNLGPNPVICFAMLLAGNWWHRFLLVRLAPPSSI